MKTCLVSSAANLRHAWVSSSVKSKAIALVASSGIVLWVIIALASGNGDSVNPKTMFGETPMCTRPSSGAPPVCGEPSHFPVPRTIYSARTAQQYYDWFQFHALLQSIPEDTYSQYLNFLGDSITESWIGTSIGKPCKRCEGIPEVMDEYFGEDRPKVLAIAGDQTQHLLYRLQISRDHLKEQTGAETAFVVNIGTNNIGAGYTVKDTVKGIVATVDELLTTTTSTHIVVLHLLPRADDDSKYKPKTLARKTFQESMDAVNKELVEYAPLVTNERVKLLNCNKPLLDKKGKLNKKLMPDSLHPNEAGHRLLAKCISDCLNKKMCG